MTDTVNFDEGLIKADHRAPAENADPPEPSGRRGGCEVHSRHRCGQFVGVIASCLLHLSDCAGSARRTEGADLAHRGRPERENHDGPLCRRARLQPACGGALWRAAAQGDLPLVGPAI